ncbi:AMP-binding protein [Breoghania sp.]|uniref:class I adenylate-forming enzyme family protein n=1 Tax=Breoghania sp. TaxID=2065378 RepID=UPI002AA7ABAD|nr:AMP-binding protein [Breoghania sp.]
MNPAEWLLRAARKAPDAPALLRGVEVVASYGEFAERAGRIAQALREYWGVWPGDRVALFMANSPIYLELLYGLWFAGAVAVPINFKLHAREAAHIVGDAQARVVFVDEARSGVAPLLAGDGPSVVSLDALAAELPRHAPLQSPHPMREEDLAWLFYTSGTTGNPKGVMLTIANLHAMAFAYFVDVDEVRGEDAALYAAPMSHGAGLYNFMHVLRGARHVVPVSGGFDPSEIADLAPRIGNVSMFAAPTMVRRLCDYAARSGYDGEGIRTIVYGGGPMYVADIERAVSQFGPRFVQIYGQGESPMTITALSREAIAARSHPRWRERLGSVGLAHSCVEVRVADENGQPVRAGETGEILVRGASVMAGYWRNPDATAETLRDGWLWTGDLGALDEDGYLTLKDRSKDVIISGGTNIYPREVEEALLTCEGVREVSVVGRAEAEWGEEVVAFVVAMEEDGLEPGRLDAHCRAQIARFKRPKHYVFLEELPKNNYGKVLKGELRRMAEEAAGRGGS